MSFFESNDHPNANNSKWLALGTIFLFLLGTVLPLIFNTTVYSLEFLIVEIALGAGTWYTAKVGIKNTFEENEDWKTDVQIASAVSNIIIPALFIALSV